MRAIILSLVFTGLLSADATTITYTSNATEFQSCQSPSACLPLVFDIPQFAGNPADLSAVEWTFTDNIIYHEGYNDMAVAPLQPLVVTFTLGDKSAAIGLDAQLVFVLSAVTCGCRNSSSAWSNAAQLTAAGQAPSLAPFEGAGNVEIDVTPFSSAMTSIPWVFGNIGPVYDNATLTLTYVDPTPTPEPRSAGLLLALLAFMIWRHPRRSRTQPHNV